MATNKKRISVYADWLMNFEELTDEELGKLMRHFFEYVNDNKPILKDRILKVAWKPIEATLKRDLIKWEETIKKRSEAGKISANKRREMQQVLTSVESVEHKPTKSTVRVTVKDTVTVKENVILKKKEIETLKDKYGLKGYEWIIDKLSNYKLSSGKTYASDYGAINSWVVKEWVKIKSVSSEAQFNSPVL